MTEAIPYRSFEEQYLSLRRKEGRLYSDDELLELPHLPGQHPLKKEWKARAFSADRLLKYLSGKGEGLKVLEIGCGNGWLCNRLSQLPGSCITGLDINREELEQAKRVFRKKGISFVEGSLNDVPSSQKFDVVVFAASIQYFLDLNATIRQALDLLNQGGELLLLDTHFYSCEERPAAQNRSRDYFASTGNAGMQEHYFHHSKEELEMFNPFYLYDPNRFINRIVKASPLPIITIKPC